jgi:hypothetical protein
LLRNNSSLVGMSEIRRLRWTILTNNLASKSFSKPAKRDCNIAVAVRLRLKG